MGRVGIHMPLIAIGNEGYRGQFDEPKHMESWRYGIACHLTLSRQGQHLDRLASEACLGRHSSELCHHHLILGSGLSFCCH